MQPSLLVALRAQTKAATETTSLHIYIDLKVQMKLMQILKKTLTTSDFSWSMISCRKLYIASVHMSVHDLV